MRIFPQTVMHPNAGIFRLPQLKRDGRLEGMKGRSWIIALCGLWEAGDIAALFVPGFGAIPAFVWNHILVGFILMLAGAWAALAGRAGTARILHWTAAAAGAWLIAAAFILGNPSIAAGLWNDIIVGGIVVTLGVWTALSARRAAG
jgi:hypothetical protein